MAVVKGDYKLLEDFITLSCEFGMDLQEKKHPPPEKLIEALYQRFKNRPKWTLTEFRDVIIDQIEENLSFPLKVDFDPKKEVQQLETVLLEIKESFYEELLEEKYILKYLFAWIDGVNLIYEVIQALKPKLGTPKFRERRHRQQNGLKVPEMLLHNAAVIFRIYETQRKIEDGLIQTNEDINLHVQLFAEAIIELSKFAIRNGFIPKISDEEEQLLEDNAELIYRVFNVINKQ
ncbi:MAG: hypothetical protein EU536_04995 [Promethearchaeota archaeon]|nr:MAG: hypothetical protein EU536_04995 [Candidatus Lokiarchaeota archaeon]